ncbi:MAG: hypothetical protein ACWA5X_11770 [bacterium]
MGRLSYLSIFLAASFCSASAQGVEVSLGQGTFNTSASLKGLMRADVDLDVTSVSIRQPSTSLGHSPWRFAGRLDLFQSGTVNSLTDFASTPVTTGLPFIGGSVDDLVDEYTPVPVPADYRVTGADVDLSLAYEVLNGKQGGLNIGVNTGLTAPFMETRHMGSDANVFLDLLDLTKTHIRTYKLGPTVSGFWRLSPALVLNAEWIYNVQSGTLDNDVFDGGVDIDGHYRSLDLNLRIQPQTWPKYLAWMKHGYLTLGYRDAQWDYDKARFSFQQAAVTVPAELDMSFSKTALYAGVGLSF